MNRNVLITLIIFSSFLSGIFGASLLNFLGWNNSDQNKVLNQEIKKTIRNIDISDLESTITQSVKDIAPSVVSIIIKKDLSVFRWDPWGFFRQQIWTVSKKVGWWTGFFITRDGKIITNKHVVSDPNAEYVVVTSDGKEHESKILALDPLSDLAIIQIIWKNDIKALDFIDDSSRIELWEFVIAIGNALAEFQNSVSFWIISGKNRSIEAPGESLNGLLQTDAAINPGNSGWPLLDLDNKVIGINTAISAEAQGIGFAIPITKKRIDYMLNSIEKYGEIKRPLVGINYQILNEKIAWNLWISVSEWAYINEKEWSILQWSSAEKAGLVGGDIILKVDDTKITESISLGSLLQNKIPWEVIRLEVLRKNGLTETLELTLGSS